MLGFKRGDYVMVRTVHAGVFAGYLEESTSAEVLLSKARRIWYWEGAASLSELSQSGTTMPHNCKFPEEVQSVYLTEVVEICNITEKAKESIASVKIWSAKDDE